MGWRIYILENNPGVLGLSLYFWKFWTKQSFTFEDSVKIVLHPLEIQRLKTKTHGNSA